MKIKGIKKTIGEIKRNTHMHYIMYCNRRTCEVWADFYADGNSWTQYHDTAICNLRHYIPEYPDKQPSMTELYTEAARIAIADFEEV